MNEDFMDAFLGGKQPPPPKAATPEKGVQIHGQKIDGRYYVRASDVVKLLAINGVLPGIQKLLREACE